MAVVFPMVVIVRTNNLEWQLLDLPIAIKDEDFMYGFIGLDESGNLVAMDTPRPTTRKRPFYYDGPDRKFVELR